MALYLLGLFLDIIEDAWQAIHRRTRRMERAFAVCMLQECSRNAAGMLQGCCRSAPQECTSVCMLKDHASMHNWKMHADDMQLVLPLFEEAVA